MISNVNSSSYTARQMHGTQHSMQKFQQQIASGKKINKAGDNAAGLAISEKLLKEANSLKAYSNNFASELDKNKIADGAFSNIGDTYSDMYANSIRAMNGIMSESDRNDLAMANDALNKTVDYIAATTKYNENFVTADFKSNINTLDANAISSQMNSVNAKRSEYGARSNGLEHAINVNNIAAENETAALSRIQDTEMEKAISGYKNQQVLNNFQNMMLKNQMSNAEGLAGRL